MIGSRSLVQIMRVISCSEFVPCHWWVLLVALNFALWTTSPVLADFLSALPTQDATLQSIVRVHCETTKGVVDIDVHPEWAPIGAAHFLELVRDGYWTDVPFLRHNKIIIQFGMKPGMAKTALAKKRLRDDPKPPHQLANGLRLRRGELSYAGGGKHTRSTAIFFVLKPAPRLGRSIWEVPFAEVVPPGMETIDNLYSGYGDYPMLYASMPRGWPESRLGQEGGAYLRRDFPLLDYMRSCTIEPPRSTVPHGLPAQSTQELHLALGSD